MPARTWASIEPVVVIAAQNFNTMLTSTNTSNGVRRCPGLLLHSLHRAPAMLANGDVVDPQRETVAVAGW
jgi:hypothetical protein